MTPLFLALALLGAKEPYARLPRKSHARQLRMGNALAVRIDTHPIEMFFTGPGELQYSAERRDVPVHIMLNEPGVMNESIDLWSEPKAAGVVSVGDGEHTIIVVADQESRGSVTLTLAKAGSTLPAAVRPTESVTLAPKAEPSSESVPAVDLSPRGKIAPRLLSEHTLKVWPVSRGHALRFTIAGKSGLRVILYPPLESDPVRLVAKVDGHPAMSAIVTPIIAFDHDQDDAAVAAPDDFPLDLPSRSKTLELTTDTVLSVRVTSEP